MAKCNSIEVPNIYPNLNYQQQFRLNKTNEVRKRVKGLVNILLFFIILINL